MILFLLYAGWIFNLKPSIQISLGYFEVVILYVIINPLRNWSYLKYIGLILTKLSLILRLCFFIGNLIVKFFRVLSRIILIYLPLSWHICFIFCQINLLNYVKSTTRNSKPVRSTKAPYHRPRRAYMMTICIIILNLTESNILLLFHIFRVSYCNLYTL